MSLLAVTNVGPKPGGVIEAGRCVPMPSQFPTQIDSINMLLPNSPTSSISSRMLFGQCIMAKEILARVGDEKQILLLKCPRR